MMASRWRAALGLATALVVALACCGGAVRERPVWADEFTGPGDTPVDHGRWQVMELAGGWGNGELQAYTDRLANVALDGAGNLRITARAEDWTDRRGNRARYTSARIESVEAFRFGRLEARVLAPVGQGLWSAFWTLGTDRERVGWPAVGEIDVMELANDTRTVELSAHGRTAARDHWRAATGYVPEAPLGGEWHVYRLDWTADRLTWFVDGVVRHELRRADLRRDQVWPFDRPQHVLLNLAVGGSWPGPPAASTRFPAHLLVDWVRVYGATVVDG